MYLKEFLRAQHCNISTVTIFGPIFGPSSNIYTEAMKKTIRGDPKITGI
jgi:hypothetical protein